MGINRSFLEAKSALEKARTAIEENLPIIFNEETIRKLQQDKLPTGQYQLNGTDSPELKNIKAILNILSALQQINPVSNPGQWIKLYTQLTAQSKHLNLPSINNEFMQNISEVFSQFQNPIFDTKDPAALFSSLLKMADEFSQSNNPLEKVSEYLTKLSEKIETTVSNLYPNKKIFEKTPAEKEKNQYEIIPGKDPPLIEQTKIMFNTIVLVQEVLKDLARLENSQTGLVDTAIHGLSLKNKLDQIIANAKKISIDEILIKEWGVKVGMQIKNTLSEIQQSGFSKLLNAAEAIENQHTGVSKGLIQGAVGVAQKAMSDQLNAAASIWSYDEPAFIATKLIQKRIEAIKAKAKEKDKDKSPTELSASQKEKITVLENLIDTIKRQPTLVGVKSALNTVRHSYNMSSEGQQQMLKEIDLAIDHMQKEKTMTATPSQPIKSSQAAPVSPPITPERVVSPIPTTQGAMPAPAPKPIDVSAELRQKIATTKQEIISKLPKLFSEEVMKQFHASYNKSDGFYEISKTDSPEIRNIKAFLNVLTCTEKMSNASPLMKTFLVLKMMSQGQHFTDKPLETIRAEAEADPAGKQIKAFVDEMQQLDFTNYTSKIGNIFSQTYQLLSDLKNPDKSTAATLTKQLDVMSQSIANGIKKLYPNIDINKKLPTDPPLVQQARKLMKVISAIKSIIKKIEYFQNKSVGISDAWKLYTLKRALSKLHKNLKDLSLQEVLLKEWGPKIALTVKPKVKDFYDTDLKNLLAFSQKLETQLGLKDKAIQGLITPVADDFREYARAAHIELDGTDAKESPARSSNPMLDIMRYDDPVYIAQIYVEKRIKELEQILQTENQALKDADALVKDSMSRGNFVTHYLSVTRKEDLQTELVKSATPGKIREMTDFKNELAKPENQTPQGLRKLFNKFQEKPIIKNSPDDKKVFSNIIEAVKNIGKTKEEIATAKGLAVKAREMEQPIASVSKLGKN